MKEKKTHTWDREPDNWYVEPSWVSRRLFEVEKFEGRTLDPCAGMGNVLIGAAEAGVVIGGSDLRNRGNPQVIGGVNFLTGESDVHRDGHASHGYFSCDNIVSNPPYGASAPAPHSIRKRLEEQFIDVALGHARQKVAVFLLTSWANAASRGTWLRSLPLYREYKVGPRPSCPPGHIIKAGELASNGTGDYSWFVFLKGYDGPPTLHWLHRDE